MTSDRGQVSLEASRIEVMFPEGSSDRRVRWHDEHDLEEGHDHTEATLVSSSSGQEPAPQPEALASSPFEIHLIGFGHQTFC